MRTGADKTILKKLYIKTVAAAVTLVIVIIMTVSVTYAWMILSTSPTASGAQITLAGGNTILIAPDVTETADGVKIHYPGKFNSKISLQYGYLSDLAGLSPVSTADGLNWVFAEFDGATGEMKPISEFPVDNTLSYANLTEYRPGGSYIYLDFWVVAPNSEYVLRVSTDTKTKEGSSLIEFPSVSADPTKTSGFSVSAPDGSSAASLRLGFLVSSAVPADANMIAYQNSAGYENRYRKLLGAYQEPGDPLTNADSYRFTIYEPNGTLHKGEADGTYIITRPIAYDPQSGIRSYADVGGILTVQKVNVWQLEDRTGGIIGLEGKFQDEVSAMSGDKTENNVMERFFDEKLNWNVMPYITSGSFFKSTGALYDAAQNGAVSAASVNGLTEAGATDDVYITTLQRNTPQRIRLFIWLEGQDADCSDIASGVTDFIINLEFAGADQ